MNKKNISGISTPEIVQSLIEEKILHLSEIRSGISREKLGWAPIIALIIALLLNILGMISQTTIYMVVWISASLYFYLFYPMLPMILFPFSYLRKSNKGPDKGEEKESPVQWVMKIKIIRNIPVGFRLFMRFFILSLLPLTLGMVFIYLISILFSLVLGVSGVIPAETSGLIFIQCAGIILFYIEIFFFRRQLVNFIGYIRRQRSAEKKRIILLGVLGFVLLIIGTVVLILLLIAILLPGFTLVSFINVNEFVKERANIWILLILISQIIIMQYLQSVLSMRVVLSMCDDLMERLANTRTFLKSGMPASSPGTEIQTIRMKTAG